MTAGSRISLILLITFIALVAVLILTIINQQSSTRISHVDSREVRPWAESGYLKSTTPGTNLKVDSEKFYKTVNTEITSDSVKITHTSISMGRDPAPPDFTRLSEKGGPLKTGGSLKLEYIASANLQNPVSSDNSHRIEMDFYHPDGSPVSKSEVMKEFPALYQRTTRFYGSNHREIRFLFRISGLRDPIIAGSSLFDKKTRVSVSNSSRYYSKDDLHTVGQVIRILHSTPLLLTMNIAHGEVENREIEARMGEKAVFTNTECRIEAFFEGDAYSTSNLNEFSIDPRFKGRTVLVLSHPPGIFENQFKVQAVKDDGEKIWSISLGGSGVGMMYIFEEAPEKINKIQITYRPHIQRAIVSFPDIPGISEENRDLENLLDVNVPYIKFEKEYEMRNFIEGILEIRIFEHGSPTTFFPKEYNNASAGEILRDYLALYPKQKIEYSKTDFTIRMSRKKDWKRIIKGYFRKIFPFRP